MRVGSSSGTRLSELQSWDPQDPGQGGAGYSLRGRRAPSGHLIHGEAHGGPRRGKATFELLKDLDRAREEPRSPTSSSEPDRNHTASHHHHPRPPLPSLEGPGHNRVGPSSWVQGLPLGPGETSSTPCSQPAPPVGRLEANREGPATSMRKEKDDESCIYSSFPGATQALFIFARLSLRRAGLACVCPPLDPLPSPRLSTQEVLNKC